MKTENKIATEAHYHTTDGVPPTFQREPTPTHQKTTKQIRTTSKHHQNHPRPPCTLQRLAGARAKFLLQNEVGTSMRRCLRDFYAVGMRARRCDRTDCTRAVRLHASNPLGHLDVAAHRAMFVTADGHAWRLRSADNQIGTCMRPIARDRRRP